MGGEGGQTGFGGTPESGAGEGPAVGVRLGRGLGCVGNDEWAVTVTAASAVKSDESDLGAMGGRAFVSSWNTPVLGSRQMGPDAFRCDRRGPTAI